MLSFLDQLKIDADIKKKVPFGSWQQVEVTFPSTPNTDLDIPHQLPTLSPDQIGFIILRQSAPGSVYRGFGAIFTNQYVRLRSNIGGLRATLLLFVPRTSFSPPTLDASGRSVTSFTSTLAIDSGATLVAPSVSMVYALHDSMMHIESTVSFTVATANANIVTATLPIPAGPSANTAASFRILSGGAFVAGNARIVANTNVVELTTLNAAQWLNGNTYSMVFQINYFI